MASQKAHPTWLQRCFRTSAYNTYALSPEISLRLLGRSICLAISGVFAKPSTVGCLLLLALLGWPIMILAADDCVDCHQSATPFAVQQWRQSGHAGKVSCADCHGDDHAQMLKGVAPVKAEVCGGCHTDAYNEHRRSKHGSGLHAGWGCTRNLDDAPRNECGFCHEQGSSLPKSVVQCARFLKQSGAMREAGCNRCHRVETDCQSCHTNHRTDLTAARSPMICAKCHMGPDHPQWEMWQTSQHGILYSSHDEEVAPGCQQCHMSAGSHDVSRGMTATPGGKSLPEEVVDERREEMLKICSGCHSRRLATEELQRGDAIRKEGLELVGSARKTIEQVAAAGRLQPGPAERPAHPHNGQALALGPEMLYEDVSHIETLYFRLKKFDFSKSWKGAFHQNPAYTHWLGNAALKLHLADIEAEALRLLQEGTPPTASDVVPLEHELEDLLRRHKAGELDADSYQAARRKILEKFGPIDKH